MEPPLLFMLLAVLVRSLVLLSHVAFMTYNNVNGQGTTRSRISNVLHESHQHGTRLHPRSVRVHIKSVRPVKIEPGQYVYLRFLGLGWLAVVQSHPFYIAWQEKDEKGCSVLVIIIERQRGLTRAMYAQESTHPAMYPQALVLDGPYGVHLDLTKYRTVLLFATGIGIAGQLPYFEHLLRCHHDRKTRSKKISLFWEIDSECEELCMRKLSYKLTVAQWMPLQAQSAKCLIPIDRGSGLLRLLRRLNLRARYAYP